MRTQMVALVLFVITLASSCTEDSSLENTDITIAQNAVKIESELLTVVNAHRASLGASELQYSAVAYEYANSHNDYMISKGSLSHDNFSSRASKISSEANAKSVAENVAKDFSNATQAFNGWLNSSSHKLTMEGDFTHTAVSVKENAEGEFYFTQLFFKE